MAMHQQRQQGAMAQSPGGDTPAAAPAAEGVVNDANMQYAAETAAADQPGDAATSPDAESTTPASEPGTVGAVSPSGPGLDSDPMKVTKGPQTPTIGQPQTGDMLARTGDMLAQTVTAPAMWQDQMKKAQSPDGGMTTTGQV